MTVSLDSAGTYQFTVRAVDARGNWSRWIAGRVLKVATFNDDAASYSRGWGHSQQNGAVGGDVTWTRTNGAWATITFQASAISVVASKFSGAGEADFWIDGRYVGRWDLYRAKFLQRGVVFGWQWPKFGSHKLTVRDVGLNNRAELQLDAFVLLN